MREFTKSVASASLASALFAARQMANVVTPAPRNGTSGQTTESFNAVAHAVAGQCGDSLREAYHALDRVQRAAVDTGFRFLSLDALGGRGASESVSGFAKQTSEQFQSWLNSRNDCSCRQADTEGSEPLP